MKKVIIRIPATTTNLGPGFDCLGLALTLYNTVELSLASELDSGLRRNDERDVPTHKWGESGKHLIEVNGEGEKELTETDSNMVFKGIKKVYSKIGKPCPSLHLKLDNQIPMARGLGSSAAAYLGGLVSANILTGEKIPYAEILELAVAHEHHPDNVIPAMVGGLVISCRTKNKTLWIKCKKPHIPSILVAIPDIPMETKESRAVLPDEVSFRDAVHNLTRTALLIGALMEGHWALLREAMEDRLHQSYRDTKSKLIQRSIQAAYKAGALGAALSGSGSTILAFVPKGGGKGIGKEKNSFPTQRKKIIPVAEEVGKAIQKVFAKQNISIRLMNLDVDYEGLIGYRHSPV